MFSKKNQKIRFDQNICNANSKDNSILFVKVKDVITDKKASVEIPVSHTAIIVKGGSDIRYYEEGPVNVFADKKEIKEWKKGYSVEVIYITKNGKITIDWGTPNKILFRDEGSSRVVNVGANGEFDISVSNALQFYKTTAVTADEFDKETYGNMFRSIVVNLFTDIFLRVIKEKKLTYDQFDANKLSIGESVGEILDEKFKREYGVTIKNFIINKFAWKDEDKNAIDQAAIETQKNQRIREYLKELERLDDKKWEREKYLRQLELQDKSAYYEVLKVIGDKSFSEKKMTKCPKCGFSVQSNDLFCPHCGKRLSLEPIVCPHCGKTNESNAIFCSKCGKKLTEGK